LTADPHLTLLARHFAFRYKKHTFGKMATAEMTEPTTPLQQELADRILAQIHAEGLEPGARLKESRLADLLGVSRSPIRAAMEILRGDGIVRHEPNRGMILATAPPAPTPLRNAGEESSALDQMLVDIARLRHERQLGDRFTESELMRHLGVDRAALREVLARIEDLGMVARKSGYGWQFTQGLRDATAKSESYRFRLLIEPAALMEPDFKLDPEWIGQMRAEHMAIMEGEWTDGSAIALFEMNARFHFGLCAASGNRYIAEAMARQNQLRRLYNYAWQLGSGRVAVTCSEHIAILDRLSEDDREMAAMLLRRHLEGAWRARPSGQRD
jgi:DNA-binding GntR family transcriptional regulator